MNNMYSESEPINEDLPDDVLFHSHVAQGEDDLIQIDNYLKNLYNSDL